MYERYESDFLFRIKAPGGKVIYRLEEEEAEAAKEAIKKGRSIPPLRFRRLVPFGQGIELDGERFVCSLLGTKLGEFATLKEALAKWDEAERYERFCRERDAELKAIDGRYYAGLQYDEDGYKVFRPRPQVP